MFYFRVLGRRCHLRQVTKSLTSLRVALYGFGSATSLRASNKVSDQLTMFHFRVLGRVFVFLLVLLS